MPEKIAGYGQVGAMTNKLRTGGSDMLATTYSKDSHSTVDPGERERLILEHAPMIKYIANRIASRLPCHVEVEDLINSGVIGLIDALEKFDPGRGIKFKSYAESRIRGAILDNLRSLDWVSRSVRRKSRVLEQTYVELQKKLGRPATEEEVAEVMGVDLEDLLKMIGEVNSVSLVYLDEVIGDDSGDKEQTLAEYLSNPDDEDPYSLLAVQEIKEALTDGIDNLPEKERLVLSLYYYEELTMKEIGKVLDVTESRVSQLHTQAILRLRGKLSNAFGNEAD